MSTKDLTIATRWGAAWMLVILAWSWLTRAARGAEAERPRSNNWRLAAHLWSAEREDANLAPQPALWLLNHVSGWGCALLPTRQPPWWPDTFRPQAISAFDVLCLNLPPGRRVRAVALRP